MSKSAFDELSQCILSYHDWLKVDDLPDAWDEMYQEYLGIKAPNRSLGVLQDVHWSMGAIGYFPTYTLGNLYAAQLLESAREDLPAYDDQIRSGDHDCNDWR